MLPNAPLCFTIARNVKNCSVPRDTHALHTEQVPMRNREDLTQPAAAGRGVPGRRELGESRNLRMIKVSRTGRVVNRLTGTCMAPRLGS